MLRICSIFVLLLLSSPVAAGFAGNIRVIDGDTLDVGGVRVRLFGIDAPEVGQPCQDANGSNWDCGTWASREVRVRYQGAVAECDAQDRDIYDRVVAICYVAGDDIGAALVSDGVATAFRKYSTSYVRAEKRAALARRGVHAGQFQRPSEYRKARSGARQTQNAARNLACVIKGNITQSGKRIFHAPGQRYYSATRIQLNRGERWFCSADQARRAGWRKALR